MFRVKIETTWSATQVRLRRVKAGLGGHDDGVFWVDDGVENSSFQLRKRGRMTLSERQTSSDFRGAEKEFVDEKWSRKKDRTTHDMWSRVHVIVCSLSAL